MKPARSATPWPARLLLGLGVGSAGILVGVALMDLGDPGAAVLGQLEREAASYEQLLQELWRNRLRIEGQPWSRDELRELVAGALTESPMGDEAGTDGAGDDGATAEGNEEQEDALRLVAARSSLARGDLGDALDLFHQVVACGGALSGEALLALCTVEEFRPGCLDRFEELASGVPWTACVNGTSGRLLALLSVARELPIAVRNRLGSELEERLHAGEVALPAPQDAAHVNADEAEWRLEMDPWWAALQARAESVFDMRMDDRERWQRAYRTAERENLAAVRAAIRVEPLAKGDWRLHRVAPRVWMSLRRNPGGASVSIERLREITPNRLLTTRGSGDLAAILRHASTGEQVPAAAQELVPITAPQPLPETDLELIIGHPDPAALVEAGRTRLAFVRYGLVALAVLLLGTTALAARLLTRARRLQTLRSTFVASVSHDLRTPLASIGLMAENLGAGYAKGSEERYAASIRRETRRLGRLVDDLLDFGRIERGLPPALQREDVEIDGWLERYGAAERARCAAAACALSIESIGELGSASLDVSALERALSNLIDNSILHGGAESVRLRVERAASQALLGISVEDEGRGFAHGTVHEHLFQAFRRDSDTEGTGLGLTIVRSIAEGHGGSVRLTAGPEGRGARAVLSIPTPTPNGPEHSGDSAA